MHAIMSTNILLAIVISACAAAGLTDEQLAQIFNETPERNIGLSETRGDYASLQDISDIDQTLSSLLANSDDTSELGSPPGGDRANRDDESYCSSRSCMNMLESLFKRSVNLDAQPRCNTTGCNITQLVKKAFCNRLGCRGKRHDRQEMTDRDAIVYPSMTNGSDLRVFDRHSASQPTSSSSESPLTTPPSEQIVRTSNSCGAERKCKGQWQKVKSRLKVIKGFKRPN